MTRILALMGILLLLWGCSDKPGGEDATEDTQADLTEDLIEDQVDTTTDSTDDEDNPETGCTSSSDCDDSDPCTLDECDTDTGDCDHTPVDADLDGYPAATVGTTNCGGSDCDDTADDVHPDADDTACDWVDNDCDTVADVMDDDGDGYGDATECSGDDCDDEASNVYPGADDTACDWVDNDCDTVLDVMDDDGDGFGDATACSEDDCDDGYDSVYPGAPGVCLDGVDQDCDTVVDDLVSISSDLLVDEGWYDNRPDMTSSGSEFALIWIDERFVAGHDVLFQRLSSDGALAGSTIQLTNSDMGRQSCQIVWTGSEYGLTWVESGGNESMTFTRLAPDGASLSSTIQITDVASQVGESALQWSGSEFAAVWNDGRASELEIYFNRWAPDGTRAGPDVSIGGGVERCVHPDMEWSGSEFAVVWADMRHDTDPGDGISHYEIYFTTVSASGGPSGSETRLTLDAHSSVNPSIAWSGSTYSIIWADRRSGAWDIYHTQVAPDGSAIVPEHEMVASGLDPRQIWTGSMAAVFWFSGGVYSLVEMTADGTFLATPVGVWSTTMGMMSQTTQAFDGTTYGSGIVVDDKIWFTVTGHCDTPF